MAATTLAESNGYTHAYHYNDPADGGDGSCDWGIYQLNDQNHGGLAPVLGADGLPHPVEGGSKTLAELEEFVAMACDPDDATVRARAMYESRGFQPWAAYNSGAWQRQIEAASLGVCNFWRERYGLPLL